jgi:predicted Fe-Mo cluster-binding NifX family protein
MRIVVTANGTDLDAQASPVFGRCPTYIFIDTETMVLETMENPAISAAGGAGVQAAQFVVERGGEAVVTGNTGPNAFNVLQSANVAVYLFAGGTVREAVEAYKAGQLSVTGRASAQAHAGMPGMGIGSGTRMGRGMGRRSGIGRGMGVGMGRRAVVPPTPPAPLPTFVGSREEEIAVLKDIAGALRKQLAELIERLDRLEEEE